MKLAKNIILSALLLLTSSTFALAQEEANESSRYDGGSFTIAAPAGWQLVSGNLSPKEIQKLPENLREHYNMRNTDVIFMNIPTQDAETKGFRDSLNIVTVSDPIPLNEDLVKELSNVLKQQYESMFEKFELESTQISKVGELEVLQVKGSYSVLNYKIKMEQYLVPSKQESLVLTCTYDTSKSDASDIIGACLKAVESLELK
ncbi:MAG: hypothetical protein J6A01_01975 [Proteobacteria bacterium]|nr:hypothetical protein [Pseudomonadota bacterium]